MAHLELSETNLLGEGSFGKVYQCRLNGSIAATKVFNISESDITVQVLQEIEVIRRLRNDYLIQFFGTAHYNNKFYFITSYSENGSLRHALIHHTLSAKRKSNIMRGLIKGMQYLKYHNVIHRDLKSSNVLLDSNYIPKICDFGLAQLKVKSAAHIKKSSSSSSLTTTRTVRWMAPELLQREPSYSFASDIYALGIVIWEILTERLPYEDIVENDIVRCFIKSGMQEVIPLNILQHYKIIISNCWHFDPEKRISVDHIDKLNDEALSRMNTEPFHVFNNKIAASAETGHTDSGYTTRQHGSSIFPHYRVTEITITPESTQYKKTIDQYMRDTSSILDAKDRLTAICQAHGDCFTRWIKESAGQGNNNAAVVLGEMYYHGCGVSQNFQASTKHFLKAITVTDQAQSNPRINTLFNNGVKEGNARVHCNLGWMYLYGQGVLQNDDKAVESFIKAATQGNASAQFSLGLMYRDGRGVSQNDRKAVEWFTKGAIQGNASAQSKLAWMYRDGRGIAQSYEKAIEWYLKAAEQGDRAAQTSLMWIYRNRQGVQQNDENAVERYSRAAEQGYSGAQFNMGWMYENGRGVPQSDDKAVEWYIKAAKKGNLDAQKKLKLTIGRGQGIPEIDAKVLERYTKAAEQGDADAQYELAWKFQYGLGVTQNYNTAVEWLMKAAEQGHLEAQNNLGQMYRDGRGVPQSDNKAVVYFMKAVQNGNANAHFHLGCMYERGRAVPQRYDKAAEMYTKAAQQGDVDAQSRLALLYILKIKLPKSDETAVEWLMKAAEQGNVDAQYRLGQMYEKGRGLSQSGEKALEWRTIAEEQRMMQPIVKQVSKRSISTSRETSTLSRVNISALEQQPYCTTHGTTAFPPLPREILQHIALFGDIFLGLILGLGLVGSKSRILAEGGPSKIFEDALHKFGDDVAIMLQFVDLIPGDVAIYKGVVTRDVTIVKKICALWGTNYSPLGYNTAYMFGELSILQLLDTDIPLDPWEWNRVHAKRGTIASMDFTIEDPIRKVDLGHYCHEMLPYLSDRDQKRVLPFANANLARKRRESRMQERKEDNNSTQIVADSASSRRQAYLDKQEELIRDGHLHDVNEILDFGRNRSFYGNVMDVLRVFVGVHGRHVVRDIKCEVRLVSRNMDGVFWFLSMCLEENAIAGLRGYEIPLGYPRMYEGTVYCLIPDTNTPLHSGQPHRDVSPPCIDLWIAMCHAFEKWVPSLPVPS